MPIKVFNYLVLFSTALTICGLFSIKEKVGAVDYQLRAALTQVEQEQGSIHLLKAEQAYLSNPERIKQLVKAHLKLETIKPCQLISDPLADKQENNFKFEETASSSSINKKKWRYKTNINNKYIQTVSSKSKAN